MMMTIRSHDQFNTTIYGLMTATEAYIMKEGWSWWTGRIWPGSVGQELDAGTW